MTKTDDGGAAFPQTWEADSGDQPTGMSLRDFSAGQALAGLLAHMVRGAAHAAEEAYRMADAMLAERSK